MLVAAILKQKGNKVITEGPDQTILSAADLMTQNRIGAVLIVEDDGRIAGILSERDIVRGVAKFGPGILNEPVSRLMTREVLTCTPNDTVPEVMRIMTDRRIRHLPVVSGGQLAGLISIGDVVKERLGEAELENEMLRSYMTGRG